MWPGSIYNCTKSVDNAPICNNIEHHYSTDVEKNITFTGRQMPNKIDQKYSLELSAQVIWKPD